MDTNISIKASSFTVLLLLSFCCFLHSSDANNKHTSIVVGTVYCDTCFTQQLSKSSKFISGASVAIECQNFKKEAKTNKRGRFKILLTPKTTVNSCSITLLESNNPFCSIAPSSSSSKIHLKSKRKNTHIYSSGFFAFKPLQKPSICDQVSSLSKAKPDFFFFPPIPFLPPPSILPPVIPSPPPSILPPVFPSPPPSLLPPILPPGLPIPLLNPPPPPPRSLFPPFPFPIPFPPNPLFPGNPPASPLDENLP